LQPFPPETSSADTWGGETTGVSTILNDGSIWQYQVNGYGRKYPGSRTGERATLQHNPSGQAYWVYPQATNSPLRAPTYDRQTARQLSNVYRSNYGTVYLSQQGTQVSGRIDYGNGRIGTFTGSISGNQLVLNWRNGADFGQAWLSIDSQSNLAGTFRSSYNGQGGNWHMSR
jgi:hypothetical protein